MCLGNVSQHFSLVNTTNTGLYGYIHDFSVNYGAIANDKILDIISIYWIKSIQNDVWIY